MSDIWKSSESCEAASVIPVISNVDASIYLGFVAVSLFPFAYESNVIDYRYVWLGNPSIMFFIVILLHVITLSRCKSHLSDESSLKVTPNRSSLRSRRAIQGIHFPGYKLHELSGNDILPSARRRGGERKQSPNSVPRFFHRLLLPNG